MFQNIGKYVTNRTQNCSLKPLKQETSEEAFGLQISKTIKTLRKMLCESHFKSQSYFLVAKTDESQEIHRRALRREGWVLLNLIVNGTH